MSTINFRLDDYQNTSAYSGLNFSVIGGVTWSTIPVTLNTIYDYRSSIKLGNLNDTFEFKIDNNNSRNKDSFRLQDKILQYCLINGASISSSNLVMTGLVKAIEERVDGGKQYLNIKGVSFDEMITNGLVINDMTNITVFEFLKQSVLSLQTYTKPNSGTSEFYLKWNADNPLLNKYNVLTNSYDGDPLPKLLGGGRVSYFNKTLNQLLNIFLNEQYTGDGRYYYYVNTIGELVIRKMLFVPSASLTEGIDNILSRNMTVDTTMIYNNIIVQAGYDPAGRAISTFYQDTTLTAQYGVRPYLLKTTDSNTLIEQERKANPNNWVSTSQYPNSYPYTCSWKDSGNNMVTASSNSDFVDKFRTEVKRRGLNNATYFVSSHSKGMRQFVIELVPTINFHLGDIVSCNFSSYNISNFPIRIYQIDFGYDNTVLTLKEEYLYAI